MNPFKGRHFQRDIILWAVGAAAVWKSAHLAGRRCRVGIGPPCQAPLPRGNRPTLPGAAAVWECTHLPDGN
ncbi:transposase for IS26 [Klebsiella pneumoniae]|nr:transposase for IS26 [Klebsiella pneumoniae]